MSSVPGSQQPTPPSLLDGVNAELQYDDAGNPFVWENGEWVPHRGYVQVLPRTSRQATIMHECGTGQWPSEPMGHALEVYSRWVLQSPATFLHHAAASGSNAAPAPRPSNIDPSLVPLPQGLDDDLIVPQVIASVQGYAPSPKVAGARRSVIELDDDSEILPKAKRGRLQGANNHTVGDMMTLLDCVEDELPLGQRGWQAITVRFNQWAAKSGRPERKLTSLETKFKQLVKTTKPTGDGECPEEVTHAHHIDSLINEHAGTRDLDDSDFNDVGDVGDGAKTSNSSNEDDELTPKAERHTVVARSMRTEAPPTRRNARGAAASELMTRISSALDPAVQRARDEEHANRSLANTHYLTLSQQLRDAQVTNEGLHSQLFDVCNQLYEVQRECDRAEMRLEMMQMAPQRRAAHTRMYHNQPKHKRQSYHWFADGGEAVAWLSDEDDENQIVGFKPSTMKNEPG
ncbi:hypothetical protein PAXRUDRAFT_169118 [Paxillus rubicundulus Ve08.2h10]|uniref:Unplaced genomic scaffold scaffold_2527, whole genome shotgun sequence n=1 Tax=Paxillus rubicundulus Ve08.2h10 TaxID=930991 RepID=A0A0D0D8I0_9AGAM|nr:hypothetical protein PAXRUDRAFT_169118 [Paxillus rubicundulus Ve08.2h10]